MFDEDGISPCYRKEHILIRAIASQYASWEDLNQRYLTERSETNKYLKNILASNEHVRNMLCEALSKNNSDEIKGVLQSYIDNAETFAHWPNANEVDKDYCDRAFMRLRNDKELYDWINEREEGGNTFRVYWFEGHIMFAVPRKLYAKVALDTDRAKVAREIANKYGLDFDDPNQKELCNKYDFCFGNEIWLHKDCSLGRVQVGFCLHHKLIVRFECKEKKIVDNLMEKFERCSLDKDNERLLQIEELQHDDCKATFKNLSDVLNRVFDSLRSYIAKT